MGVKTVEAELARRREKIMEVTERLLEFWFGAQGSEEYGQNRTA